MTPAALTAAMSGNLEDLAAATAPGGIEWQEAAGQKQLTAHAFPGVAIGLDGKELRDAKG